jgi:hypothetical protein
VSNRVTVLEGIISDIGAVLYQKWWNALLPEEQTEEKSAALAKNAGETAFWVIQEFMNRFNSAADELKNTIDESESN